MIYKKLVAPREVQLYREGSKSGTQAKYILNGLLILYYKKWITLPLGPNFGHLVKYKCFESSDFVS